MEILYGVRFNGRQLAIYKYQVVQTYQNDLMELNNISPGINKMATHASPRVHKSKIGCLLEQDNSYTVYIKSLDSLKNAVQIIAYRVEDDKAVYLEAINKRLSEFDSQLLTINNADLSDMIQAFEASA